MITWITKDRRRHLHRENHTIHEDVNRATDQRDWISKGTVIYVDKMEEDRRNGYSHLLLKSLKKQDIPGEVKEIIVEKAFNSKMMEIFQGSNIEEILEKMFAYIKTQIENPALPKSGFTLDSIIHLDISFP